MLTINVRLLLALPVYLLAALTMLALLATGVSTLISIVHLDLPHVIAGTIAGSVIAMAGGLLAVLAAAIHGTKTPRTA